MVVGFLWFQAYCLVIERINNKCDFMYNAKIIYDDLFYVKLYCYFSQHDFLKKDYDLIIKIWGFYKQ